MLSTSKKHTLEITTISLYAILLAVVSYFHEPWFDEAQAWLIARDSSLFDMIWNVLRYEGHTPLWYLVLYVPTHLNLPFELSIKAINIIFATLAATVFIRYSPFPLMVRLLTPFTYFLFYQYGVISRSYSLLILILWITAAVFPKRNEKPFLFSLLLALMGGVTVHGTLIAFGIAIAWLIEILMDYRKEGALYSQTLKRTVSDRRFHSLIFLGFINIVYVAILWPMPDRHTPQHFYQTAFSESIHKLLTAPIGALFYTEDPASFSNSYATASSVYLSIAGLFLITIFIIWALNSGKKYYLLLPYLALTLFMACIYFSVHHTGLYALLILFLLWISMSGGPIFKPSGTARRLYRTLSNNGKHDKLYKKLFAICLIFFLSIQIYWSISASFHDIERPYAQYRELAAFIHDKKIAGSKIFDYYFVDSDINSYHTKNCAVLAYFSNNIFYNHNLDNPSLSHAIHRKINEDYLLERLKSSGKPEFILWNKNSLPFYGEIFDLSNYRMVKSFMGYYFWKDSMQIDNILLYMRKDLIAKYPQLKTPAVDGIP